MAQEIWNGHARLNLPGWSGTAPTYKGLGNAKGLVFGPGPTTADRYFGSFGVTDMSITMKVNWRENAQ